jgi:hypothetical protein
VVCGFVFYSILASRAWKSIVWPTAFEIRHCPTATGLFHVRFMDDVLVLAPARWKLRRTVGLVNTILGSLRLEKHPDKAFIGRIDRGFDFLGYRFTANSLTLAVGTMANFAERVSRFYAQERDGPDGRSRPGAYVRRWWAWASGGLTSVDPAFTPPFDPNPQGEGAYHRRSASPARRAAGLSCPSHAPAPRTLRRPRLAHGPAGT